MYYYVNALERSWTARTKTRRIGGAESVGEAVYSVLILLSIWSGLPIVAVDEVDKEGSSELPTGSIRSFDQSLIVRAF